jgi:hypothetical protein
MNAILFLPIQLISSSPFHFEVLINCSSCWPTLFLLNFLPQAGLAGPKPTQIGRPVSDKPKQYLPIVRENHWFRWSRLQFYHTNTSHTTLLDNEAAILIMAKTLGEQAVSAPSSL